MPKIDEQISYNWLFFLLAGAFGAVTLWAVYDEAYTRREWKSYQEEFFKIERKLASDAYNDVDKKLKASPEFQKVTAEKAAIEQRRKQRASEIAKAQGEEENAKFAFNDAQQAYTFTKSILDEQYYFYTLAKHDGTPDEIAKRQKEYEDLQKQLAEKDAKRNEEQKKYAEKQKHTAELTESARYQELSETIDKLQKEVTEAKLKKEAAEAKSSEIIQQNLEDINRVDRCESCHLGSARGGFEKVTPKYFASHPYRRTLFKYHPPETFGCTTCHDGQGRATQKFHAHAPSKDEQPHAVEKHFWEEPLLHGAFMESNCRKCHGQEYYLRSQISCEIDVECPKGMTCAVPTLWTPGAGMPLPETIPAAATEGAKKEEAKMCVDQDGRAPLVDLAPHLSRGRRIIEEVGCFGCHPIEGYEGLPKIGPDLRHAKDKLDAAWMATWIHWPKGLRSTTRMPNFFPEDREGATKEYPRTAMPQYVDRKQDPEHPEHWKPEQQIAALISFLYANSTPYEAKVKSLPVAGNAQRGKELIGSVGCMGCHTFSGFDKKVEHKNRASHFDHGPDLANVGAKTTVEWLFSWLKDPKSYNPQSRMPNLRLTDQEAADIASYLITQKKAGDEKVEIKPISGIEESDKSTVTAGQTLVKYYGCYGCHSVKGFETTAGIGVELTEFGAKTVERLDYGDYIVDHNAQTWDKWTWHKLKHPRVYRYERVDTRMPQFDLTDDEITDVMVVLKGLRGEERDGKVLGHKLDGLQLQREEGRRLVRWFNCFGCHPVDNFNPDIRQIYPPDQLSYAPPNINGEGIKAQPDWLFGFLKNVIPLRPWLTVRMPTFGFDDDQATNIVGMFSGIDQTDFPFRYYGDIKLEGARREIATKLFANFKCQQCHVVGDQKLTAEQAASAAPNLLLAKHRLRAEWIAKWLENPEALMPGTRMPSFFAGGANVLDALMGTPGGKATFGGIPGIEEVRKGGARSQIEVLRDYLMTFEGVGAVAAEKPGAKPAKGGKKKAAAPAAPIR